MKKQIISKKLSALTLATILASSSVSAFAMQSSEDDIYNFQKVENENLNNIVNLEAVMNELIKAEKELAGLEPVQENEMKRQDLLDIIDLKTNELRETIWDSELKNNYIDSLLGKLKLNGAELDEENRAEIKRWLVQIGDQNEEALTRIEAFHHITNKIEIYEEEQSILGISNLARVFLLSIENHNFQLALFQSPYSKQINPDRINAINLVQHKTTLDFLMKKPDMNSVLNDSFGGVGSFFMGLVSHYALAWHTQPTCKKLYLTALESADELSDAAACAKIYDSLDGAKQSKLITEDEYAQKRDILKPINEVLNDLINQDDKKLSYTVTTNIYCINYLKENGFITPEYAKKVMNEYLLNQTMTEVQSVEDLKYALNGLNACLGYPDIDQEIVFNKTSKALDLLKLPKYQDYNFNGWNHADDIHHYLMNFMKYRKFQEKCIDVFLHTPLYEGREAFSKEFIDFMKDNLDEGKLLLNIAGMLLRGNIKISQGAFKDVCSIPKIDQAIQQVQYHNLVRMLEEKKVMKLDVNHKNLILQNNKIINRKNTLNKIIQLMNNIINENVELEGKQ